MAKAHSFVVATVCLILVLAAIAGSAPAYDYDSNIRDLYELLLRTEGFQAPVSRFAHQMERKGGRSPTLRLRFGRRADPLWAYQQRQSFLDNASDTTS